MLVSEKDSMNASRVPCREIAGDEAFRRAAETGRGGPPETGMRQNEPCAWLRGDENTISRLSDVQVAPVTYSPSNVSCRGWPPRAAGITKISRFRPRP